MYISHQKWSSACRSCNSFCCCEPQPSIWKHPSEQALPMISKRWWENKITETRKRLSQKCVEAHRDVCWNIEWKGMCHGNPLKMNMFGPQPSALASKMKAKSSRRAKHPESHRVTTKLYSISLRLWSYTRQIHRPRLYTFGSQGFLLCTGRCSFFSLRCSKTVGAMVHEKIPEAQISSNQIKTNLTAFWLKKGNLTGNCSVSAICWGYGLVHQLPSKHPTQSCRSLFPRRSKSPPGVSDWANPSTLFLVTVFDLELQ